MAGSPSSHDSGVTPDRGSPPRMPRWVKAAVLIVGILLLLFAVMRITGLGGEHGPGRHMPAGIGLTDQRGGV
ncbi:hypothetical protein EDD27_5356 [Nonomuraea polychroma]|uniref:Uncharacterized protein n=1 Tax=Nonomuraea polychroma TaxID=46176 RepID=A0A438MAJ1_9ACTN|nr:hypothetical protein [Nonomuraea polychroma]RVX42708.1 hypothetical protein EDD27_5356 [Nonomuraea polychroma]